MQCFQHLCENDKQVLVVISNKPQLKHNGVRTQVHMSLGWDQFQLGILGIIIIIIIYFFGRFFLISIFMNMFLTALQASSSVV